MIRNLVLNYCERKTYCNYLDDYNGNPAIEIKDDKPYLVLSDFLSYIRGFGIDDISMIVSDMKVDEVKTISDDYIVVYFVVDNSQSKSSIRDNFIENMSSDLYNNINFSNWREDWVANYIKLALEYLMLGNGLDAVHSQERIIDEIIDTTRKILMKL